MLNNSSGSPLIASMSTSSSAASVSSSLPSPSIVAAVADRKPDSPTVRAFKDILAGTAGGFAICFIGHPFDTLKVRLQTQPMDKPIYNGLVDCARKTIKWEGFGGLYKGIGSPLIGQMLLRASMFGILGEAKLVAGCEKGKVMSIPQGFMAGAMTGALVSLVESPVDFFKSQLQFQIIREKIVPGFRAPFHNIFECVGYITRQNGLLGAYQGLGATILRNTPANCLYFGMNEVTRHAMNPDAKTVKDYTVNQVMAAGAVAGMSYWTLMFPLDVVKSAMQTDSLTKSDRRYSSIVDCVKKLYAEGGIRRFYRGLSPCFLRSIPANMVLLSVFETTRMYLDM